MTGALIQIWPLVEAALQLFSTNPTAVEQICRTPRYALRTAGKLAQTGSIVSTMMAAVPRWFQAAHHSSFLYLASELVKTFGNVSRQEGALGKATHLHALLCMSSANYILPYAFLPFSLTVSMPICSDFSEDKLVLLLCLCGILRSSCLIDVVVRQAFSVHNQLEHSASLHISM